MNHVRRVFLVEIISTRGLFALIVVWGLSAQAALVNDWEPGLNKKRRNMLWGQALLQSEVATPAWDPGQRDCAGFVRFLYRTSVTGNAKMWLDAQGRLVEFLSAEKLIQSNFKLVSRNIENTKLITGDILVYFRPEYVGDSAWHLMVILSPESLTAQKNLVIYHNGSSGKNARIRKVWLDTIQENSWGVWRPLPSNPYFQGVYRWKGWEDSRFFTKVSKH